MELVATYKKLGSGTYKLDCQSNPNTNSIIFLFVDICIHRYGMC